MQQQRLPSYVPQAPGKCPLAWAVSSSITTATSSSLSPCDTDEMLAQAREMVSGESEAERAATEAEEEQAAAKKQAEAAEAMERAEADRKAADAYSALAAAKREAGKEREQRQKRKK
jgi:hypothetical protein